ncbi:hypothetical protein [Ruminococcus sp. HUN007]|uniref:hypothetical protein n=1 Tax=Ruminococcus sp. HUN007 TaxID=1514668 RepID=UPI0005D2B816|nr:hypothetical protein [Ruminococcus sp. HUN007]
MTINNESILIIGGEAAEKIISGESRVTVFQRSVAGGFRENSLARFSPLIQCISPSVNDTGAKLKFSVKQENGAAFRSEASAFFFETSLELTFEIRSGSETVQAGECSASGFIIKPSDTEGRSELEFVEFITGSDDGRDELAEAVCEIKGETRKNEEEIKELEEELLRYEEENRNLGERKQEINEKLISLREENSEIEKSIAEINELESRHAVLSENLNEIKENKKTSDELLTELKVFSGILDHYRNDNGFETVKEKLERLISAADEISDDISAMAEKRAGELK